MCGWKNSFRALAKKEKLLGAWDQGTAKRWLRRWPERLLNITSNYITLARVDLTERGPRTSMKDESVRSTPLRG